MIKLESRRYSVKEWNSIFDKLKARDDLAPNSFSSSKSDF